MDEQRSDTAYQLQVYYHQEKIELSIQFNSNFKKYKNIKILTSGPSESNQFSTRSVQPSGNDRTVVDLIVGASVGDPFMLLPPPHEQQF